MRMLSVPERLIVAADFMPTESGLRGIDSVEGQVLALARQLQGTGVYLKVNSALRACGYELIEAIHDQGLRVFADLKLNDIPETLATDGALLQGFKPELMTVMASTGRNSISKLKSGLPNTEMLGVTVLTSLGDDESRELFGNGTENAVCKLAEEAHLGGADGVVASAHEAEMLRKIYGEDALWPNMTINTPGIRPLWSQVANDDQKRSATPASAIRAGADRVVIGRPITQAANPLGAVKKTLDEIESVL